MVASVVVAVLRGAMPDSEQRGAIAAAEAVVTEVRMKAKDFIVRVSCGRNCLSGGDV